MDLREAPNLAPERLDSVDKVGQIGRSQMIVAIAGAIVGRMPSRCIDLCLRHATRRQERMDRMAQRIG
ncbi:hypothetical protein [Sphingomonas sp.]|uniref:hypothetical protein n=1 Tax=Sphingomonas sp. TaxID=28214 RepID=UPI0025CCA074|nr:hypothetical protein [Sphingomonas sp.]